MKRFEKAENVAWTELNERVFVLDTTPEQRCYFELNSTGSWLWKNLENENGKLLEGLIREFEVSETQANEDLQTFFSDLESKGLISQILP